MARVLRISADIVVDGDGDTTFQEDTRIREEVGQYVDAVIGTSLESLVGVHKIQQQGERNVNIHWHRSDQSQGISCSGCLQMSDDDLGA